MRGTGFGRRGLALLGAALLAALAPAAGTAAGGRPYLVEDLVPGPWSAGPTILATLGGRQYFAATGAGTEGRELWSTDGTAAGTALVRDINPGSLNAEPTSLIPSGAGVFFGTPIAQDKFLLWKSDGTEAGTALAARLTTSQWHTTPLAAVDLDGTLIFTAPGTSYWQQGLWRSDGTEGGTGELGKFTTNPRDLRRFGDEVFFFGGNSTNVGLWKTDGTAAGTVLVKALHSPYQLHAQKLTVVGGGLFFTSYDTTHGTELWRSDGTEAGTALVKDIMPSGSSDPGFLTDVGGRLFFGASDGAHGYELWTSDGTEAGTRLVKDINTTGGYTRLGNFTAAGGTLFFTADDGGGQALWKSDGTEAGTVKVSALPAAGATACVGVGNAVFFACAATASGAELWRSDGSAAGTVLVKDIVPGAAGSSPQQLTAVDGVLLFTADDGAGGRELWRSDGTADGTRLVREIVPGAAGSSPEGFVRGTGPLFFLARNAAGEVEVWKTDATSAGTVLVANVKPIPLNSSPGDPVVVGGTLFFTAADEAHGRELWTSDGTAEGTVLVRDINPGAVGSEPLRLVAHGNEVYFAADDGAHGLELWRSDGTPEGTAMVGDLNPGTADFLPAPGSYVPSAIVSAGSLLFFRASGPAGAGLWRSDGTAVGTLFLSRPDAYGFDEHAVLDGVVYFSWSDAAHGGELWKSDGTPGGTVMVRDLNPGAEDGGPGSLFAGLGSLFFEGSDGTTHGLWKSDGTAGGTLPVKGGISLGSTSSIWNRIAGRDRVYFAGYEGHGDELWRSDGTEAGTFLVKDIYLPGGGSVPDAYPDCFALLGDTLYFNARDQTHTGAIWKSDGTEAGTVRVTGHPETGTWRDGCPVPANGGVLFSGSATVSGSELWGTLPDLVINEVDYDQPGADTGEFVEVRNNGQTPVELSRFTLELVDGSGGAASVYRTVALPGTTLAAGGHFVVCAQKAGTPYCDLEVSPGIELLQDGGPAAVALRFGQELVDTVSYGGDTAAPYTEGSGQGLADSGAAGEERKGLSRIPDGADTGVNNADFSAQCATPGEANALGSACVNAKPSASNLNQTVKYPVGQTSVAIEDIVVTDPDPAETITATLVLADPARGSLTASGAATYDAGSGTWQVTGTVAEVNAALAAVAFLPGGGSPQDCTVASHVADGAGSGPPDGVIVLDVLAVNTVPVATRMSQSVAYVEDDPTVPLQDIVVTDLDADERITVTLRLSDTAAGRLTAGVLAKFLAATGVWSATGSAAEVNAALSTVSFQPAADYERDLTIAVRVRDAAGAGPADGVISLTATSVNDAPTAVGMTQQLAYFEDAGGVDLLDVVVRDPDEGDTIVAALALQSPAAGALTTDGGGAYDASAGRWSASGGVGAVNAALAAVRFVPARDANADVTIAVSVRDAAGLGPADGAILLHGYGVDDPPVAVADAYTAYADKRLTVDGLALPGVLANDADADGEPLEAFQISGVSHGSLGLRLDGTFAYTPNKGFTGTDSFTYCAAPYGYFWACSAPARVRIVVRGTRLFRDTFADGGTAGDAHWLVRSGSWSVSALKQYLAGSASPALATVKALDPRTRPFAAGRIESKLRLAAAAGTVPNASIVFAYRDRRHYRYLTVQKGGLVLGQVGALGGTAGGVHRRATYPFGTGSWRTVRIDLRPDGWVQVRIKGALRLAYRYASQVSGGVGLAAYRSAAAFDDFTVWDEHALP